MVVRIFIDDFEHAKSPNSQSSVISDGIGYVAAIVRDSHYAALEAGLSELLATWRAHMRSALPELHGYDIAAGVGSWRGTEYESRAGVFSAALHLAHTCGVVFVYELLQKGDPQFPYVLNKIKAELRRRGRKGQLGRWNERKLALATLVRHRALVHACRSLSASSILLVEDVQIPHDDELERRWIGAGARGGIPITFRPKQDSTNWFGLQMADLASKAMGTRAKIADLGRGAQERGEGLDQLKLDGFSQALLATNVFPLLDDAIRALQAEHAAASDGESHVSAEMDPDSGA